MPDRIAVILTTTHDRRAYAEACLASIASERSSELEVTVFLIGNGSDPCVEESDWVETIVLDNQECLAATHNRGLNRAREHGSTCALILNDDTKVQAGMFSALCEALNEHPDSVMTPLQLEMDADAQLDEQAMEFIAESEEFVGDAMLGRTLKTAYPTPGIVGAAFFARIEVFDTIGPFDELFAFYCVDDDYCARARHREIPLLIVPRARLEHAHGRYQDDPKTNADRWFFRWRTHQQGRILMNLKQPDRSLASAYAREAARVKLQALSCVLQGWPRGAVTLFAEFTRLTFQLPRIAQHRRDHYPPR